MSYWQFAKRATNFASIQSSQKFREIQRILIIFLILNPQPVFFMLSLILKAFLCQLHFTDGSDELSESPCKIYQLHLLKQMWPIGSSRCSQNSFISVLKTLKEMETTNMNLRRPILPHSLKIRRKMAMHEKYPMSRKVLQFQENVITQCFFSRVSLSTFPLLISCLNNI